MNRERCQTSVSTDFKTLIWFGKVFIDINELRLRRTGGEREDYQGKAKETDLPIPHVLER